VNFSSSGSAHNDFGTPPKKGKKTANWIYGNSTIFYRQVTTNRRLFYYFRPCHLHGLKSLS